MILHNILQILINKPTLHLFLENCDLNRDSLQILCTLIRKSTTLEEISMHYCTIFGIENKMLSMIKIIADNKKIIKLLFATYLCRSIDVIAPFVEKKILQKLVFALNDFDVGIVKEYLSNNPILENFGVIFTPGLGPNVTSELLQELCFTQ